MMQLYQDFMAIVQYFNQPTLFPIFIANPKWEEIEQQLLSGQQAFDQPDFITQVFQLKKKKMLWLIKNENIFS